MPTRLLKESICSSESIKSLSWFEEVTFYRLIVNADDYGRLDGRIDMLQSKLYPVRRDITETAMKKALNTLSTAGMVQTYECDGRPFLQLVSWEQHQQVRAKKSKFPAPDNNCLQMITNVPVIQSESYSNIDDDDDSIAREEMAECYHIAVGRKATAAELSRFVQWRNYYSSELIIEAIRRAAQANANNIFAYASTCLQTWLDKGITTLDDLASDDFRRDEGPGSHE